MTTSDLSGERVKCSFCSKSRKQVEKLIAGPDVYICDECIDLCRCIIEEERALAERRCAVASCTHPEGAEPELIDLTFRAGQSEISVQLCAGHWSQLDSGRWFRVNSGTVRTELEPVAEVTGRGLYYCHAPRSSPEEI